MEFITIHHPKLKLEAVVARSTFDNLAPKGWKEGALPSPKRDKSSTTEDE